MALSTAVFVGESKNWMSDLIERAKKLKVNAGTQDTLYMYRCFSSLNAMLLSGDQPGADMGPLITPEAKQRVCELVQSGVDQGAKVQCIITGHL